MSKQTQRSRSRRMAMKRVMVEVRAFRGLFAAFLLMAMIVAATIHDHRSIMAKRKTMHEAPARIERTGASEAPSGATSVSI